MTEPLLVSAEDFCAALSSRLVGSLTLFCGSRDAAEDIAQEALARALERWNVVQEKESPEAWTYRTAFNLARTQARRRQTERRALERLDRVGGNLAPDTATAIAVRDAVRRLPTRQRGAIILRFYAGLSLQETADAMGCAPGTVKAHVFKAMTNLRKSGLIDEIEEPGDESSQ